MVLGWVVRCVTAAVVEAVLTKVDQILMNEQVTHISYLCYDDSKLSTLLQ